MPHDPRGRSRFPLPPGVAGSSVLSDDERYRQTLVRRWRDGPRCALWIGMNPSTALHDVDDPTVRIEWTYTRDRLGLDFYVRENVLDYRATFPKDLLGEGVIPRSCHNLPAILSSAENAEVIVLAYGALAKPLRPYAVELLSALRTLHKPLRCPGLTKDGSPRHALRFMRKTADLIDYPSPASVIRQTADTVQTLEPNNLSATDY